MRTKLTSGLVVLGLQALTASASAQGYYYYPVPMPYPAPMYTPAADPRPSAPAARPSLPDRPPEGILSALLRGNPKPMVTPVQATEVRSDTVVQAPPKLPAAPPAPIVVAP